MNSGEEVFPSTNKIRFPFNEKYCKAKIVNFLKIMETYSFSIAKIVWRNFFLLELDFLRVSSVKGEENLISNTHETLIYLCLESGSINWNGIKIINLHKQKDENFNGSGDCAGICLITEEVLVAIIKFGETK